MRQEYTANFSRDAEGNFAESHMLIVMRNYSGTFCSWGRWRWGSIADERFVERLLCRIYPMTKNVPGKFSRSMAFLPGVRQ
jgi:hypothetical protein